MEAKLGNLVPHDRITDSWCILQASWDEGVSSYTEQELQGIFRAHGEVQEAILRPVKKKNKGSAIIIMRDGQVNNRLLTHGIQIFFIPTGTLAAR